jgi:D-glycero-alpha-D-manno-heptose 1-phosphate guanylyltransferase
MNRTPIISVVVEKTPLGTGGAIRYAIQNSKLVSSLTSSGHVMILNGDTALVDGIKKLDQWISNHGNIKPNQSVFTLIKVDDVSRYGSIELDPDHKILQFLEKDPSANFQGLINAGLVLAPIQSFLISNEVFSAERYLYPQWVKNKSALGALINTTFIDIGIPKDYEKFKSFVLPSN